MITSRKAGLKRQVQRPQRRDAADRKSDRSSFSFIPINALRLCRERTPGFLKRNPEVLSRIAEGLTATKSASKAILVPRLKPIRFDKSIPLFSQGLDKVSVPDTHQGIFTFPIF